MSNIYTSKASCMFELKGKRMIPGKEKAKIIDMDYVKKIKMDSCHPHARFGR